VGSVGGGLISGADTIDLAYDSGLDITRVTVVPEPVSIGLIMMGSTLLLALRRIFII
jgi:hypothetical protein